jgi:CDP-diglyceride synthetase
MRTQPNKKTTGFDFQWLFAFSIVVGGFYLIAKPAMNGKVLIFRLAVVAFGIVGLIVTTLVKRRQRAKST